MSDGTPSIDPLLQRIAAALEGLRFGTVEIAVHDSKVVYVERRERLRIADAPETGNHPPSAGRATERPERARDKRTS